MIRFMTFLDVTDIYKKKNILQIAFDFPNTVVEPREHYHEPWLLVNTLPAVDFVSDLPQILCLAVYRNIFPVETWKEWINCI
jgi:hypothetical protein